MSALPTPLRVAVWSVLASLAFAAMSGLIKLLSQDLHPFQAAFFRCAFGLMWMLPWLFRRGSGALRTTRMPLYLARAGLGVVGMLAGFYAIGRMPLAEASALSFTAPLFATVGAALILHETVRLRRWTATLLGFAGVLIILRPGFASVDPVAFWMLLSAATMAANSLIMKTLTRTDSTEAVVTWMVLLLAPLTLVAAIPVWQTPSLFHWGLAVALGLSGTLGHLALTRAFAAGEASLVMTFEYVRLPLSALIGMLLFAEMPTVWIFVGAAVIAGSSAYIAHRETRLERSRSGGPDQG